MRMSILPLISLGLLALQGASAADATGSTLTWYGRSSVKLHTASGLVIYIDPYAPGDYSEPADLILVTHGHGDHNQVGLVARKAGTVIAAPKGAVAEKGVRVLAEEEGFSLQGITVKALPAANRNHRRPETVGWLLSFDGIVLYHAGDTSFLPEMDAWKAYGIDYALLPCDGFYNMGPEEASRCAAAMGAKAVVPIHSSKSELYDAKNAKAVAGAKVVLLSPGETAKL